MNKSNRINRYFEALEQLSHDLEQVSRTQALVRELEASPGLKLLREVEKQLGRSFTGCCENMSQRQTDLEAASEVFVTNGLDLNKVCEYMNGYTGPGSGMGRFQVENGVLVCGGCFDTNTLFDEAGKQLG